MRQTFLVTVEVDEIDPGLGDTISDILSNHYEWVDVEEQESAADAADRFDVRLTHVGDRTISTIKALRDLELPRRADNGAYLNDLKFQRDLVFTVLGRNPIETPYDRVNTMLATGVTRQRAKEIEMVLDLVGARVRIYPSP